MHPKNKNSGAQFEKEVEDLYDTPPAPKEDEPQEQEEDGDEK